MPSYKKRRAKSSRRKGINGARKRAKQAARGEAQEPSRARIESNRGVEEERANQKGNKRMPAENNTRGKKKWKEFENEKELHSVVAITFKLLTLLKPFIICAGCFGWYVHYIVLFCFNWMAHITKHMHSEHCLFSVSGKSIEKWYGPYIKLHMNYALNVINMHLELLLALIFHKRIPHTICTKNCMRTTESVKEIV